MLELADFITEAKEQKSLEKQGLVSVATESYCTSWCPGRELNPYARRLRILSPLRLPISSPGHQATGRSFYTSGA